jgi:hypothetical protein
MVDDTATGEVKGARARFRSWSRATRILAGLVAVCTGITGVAGAVKLGAEVYQSFEKRNEPPTAFDRTPVMGLQFWQDGAQRRMDDEPAAGDKVIVVEMAPRPFEIWFPSGSMASHSCGSAHGPTPPYSTWSPISRWRPPAASGPAMASRRRPTPTGRST